MSCHATGMPVAASAEPHRPSRAMSKYPATSATERRSERRGEWRGVERRWEEGQGVPGMARSVLAPFLLRSSVEVAASAAMLGGLRLVEALGRHVDDVAHAVEAAGPSARVEATAA